MTAINIIGIASVSAIAAFAVGFFFGVFCEAKSMRKWYESELEKIDMKYKMKYCCCISNDEAKRGANDDER